MSEPINELRLIRSTVEALADKLNKMLSALNDITESVNNLRKRINELGISDVGREQFMKSLDGCLKQWAVLLNGYVKDAVVRKLNVTVSNLTKG